MAEEILQNITRMPESQQLLADVCHIIDDTRTRVSVYVNSEVCMMNWRIGTRIKEDVLYNKRAEYGKQVLQNLAAQLTERYGKGWGYSTLQHCVRAAYTFTEDSPIKVAQYYTQLPDKRILAEKLQRAIAIAREHCAENKRTK